MELIDLIIRYVLMCNQGLASVLIELHQAPDYLNCSNSRQVFQPLSGFACSDRSVKHS